MVDLTEVDVFEVEDKEELSEHVDHILSQCVTVASGQSSFDEVTKRDVSVSLEFIAVDKFKEYVQEQINLAEEANQSINISYFKISGLREINAFRRYATITIVRCSESSDHVEIDTVYQLNSARNLHFDKLVGDAFELVKRYNLKREIDQHLNLKLSIENHLSQVEHQEDGAGYGISNDFKI